ncbi:hypothetical protein GQ53DRAFT_51015 [Thozetella sp. PMI_491]|nr:hypothetical protein GQ53DRAFT_51015 [Thozetella sp. PMI_491]
MELDQQGNVVRRMSGKNLNSSIPLHQRDEWWIRWPASVISVPYLVIEQINQMKEKSAIGHKLPNLLGQLWLWVTSDIAHVLLLAVPLALAAGSRNWPTVAVFALGVLAFAGLDAFTGSSLDRVCLLLGPGASGFCADVIMNITPTTITTVALIEDQLTLARNIIVGNAIINALLVTGTAMFFSGLVRDEITLSEDCSLMPELALLAMAPVTIVYLSNGITSPGDLISISRCMTIVSVIAYAFWIIYWRVTHRYLLDDTTGERPAVVVRLSRTTCVLYVLAAAASFIATIFVARYTSKSVGILVQESYMTNESIGIIIIPLAISFSRTFKAAILSRGRENDALERDALGVVVGSILFSLPFILAIAWGTNRGLLMDLPSFQVASLLISVLTIIPTFRNQKFTYFEGVMQILLYVIIARVFFERV